MHSIHEAVDVTSYRKQLVFIENLTLSLQRTRQNYGPILHISSYGSAYFRCVWTRARSNIFPRPIRSKIKCHYRKVQLEGSWFIGLPAYDFTTNWKQMIFGIIRWHCFPSHPLCGFFLGYPPIFSFSFSFSVWKKKFFSRFLLRDKATTGFGKRFGMQKNILLGDVNQLRILSWRQSFLCSVFTEVDEWCCLSNLFERKDFHWAILVVTCFLSFFYDLNK